MFVFALLVSTS